MWSGLHGIWGDPNVSSLTLLSMTTYKEASSNKPTKKNGKYFGAENF